MKLTLSLILFSLVSHCANGQTASSDKIKNLYEATYNSLDSEFKLQKNADIEFRLWTNPSLIFYRNCFILTKHDGIWTARFFEFTGGQKGKWTETKTKETNLDSIWRRLVKNQVMTLPTQDSLNSRMRIFSADSTLIYYDEDDVYKKVVVNDGAVYTFQIMTKNFDRTYQYHSPVSYLKHNPNIEELYRAYAIISIIRKYLGLALENE